MEHKWIPCSVCGFNGLLKASPGVVDGRRLHIKYNWICLHCKAPQEVIPMNDILNTEEYFDETLVEETTQEQIPLSLDPRLPSGIKFLHININGLRSKFDEVYNLLVSEKNILCMAITESKLKENRDRSSMYEVPGFVMFRSDRLVGEGGGNIIYVNKNCECELVDLENIPICGNVEFKVFKIKQYGIKPILFCVVYIPPNHVNDELFIFLNLIFDNLYKHGLEVVVVGDFNIDFMKNSAELKKLKNIINEAGLTQRVNFPTRIASTSTITGFKTSSTLIDHIFVNHPEKYSVVSGFDFAGSDHKLV